MCLCREREPQKHPVHAVRTSDEMQMQMRMRMQMQMPVCWKSERLAVGPVRSAVDQRATAPIQLWWRCKLLVSNGVAETLPTMITLLMCLDQGRETLGAEEADVGDSRPPVISPVYQDC